MLLDIDGADRSRIENSFNASTAAVEAPTGKAELNDLSQIDNRARPCATEARRPTVHMMAASWASSRYKRSIGFLWAASTNGRVVEA